MNEDSSLSAIYIGAMTTVMETLTEQAQLDIDPEDDPEVIKMKHSVKSLAVQDLVSVANQLRNHDRLDTIIADADLAKAYFMAGKALNQ